MVATAPMAGSMLPSVKAISSGAYGSTGETSWADRTTSLPDSLYPSEVSQSSRFVWATFKAMSHYETCSFLCQLF